MIKKRFIAGAICPRCKAMDRLVTYKQGEKEFRECVACDFQEEMYFKKQVKELETRVNTTEAEKSEAVQVLMLDPNGSDTKH